MKNSKHFGKNIPTEYRLPLVAFYPNGQSATFFIFKNYLHNTERMSIKND